MSSTPKEQPLVSVVMIFLNAEAFMEEAIASVVAQTHTNWELIFVDDGSTDRSPEIARRHVSGNPLRMRCLQHDGHANLGMSSSRNLGIEHARGEFIGLLDADDVWLPHKLEKQVAILRSHPKAGMVYGPTQIWRSWNGSGEDTVQELGVPVDSLVRPPSLVSQFLYDDRRSPRTCSVLMRREAVKRVGGFESSFRGLFEDQAFFNKLCLQEPVYVVGECCDRYRQHPQSCCSQASKLGEYFVRRVAFLDWLEKYMNQRQIKNTEIAEAMRSSRQNALQRSRRMSVRSLVRGMARKVLPASVRQWYWESRADTPPVGQVRFGDLRRTGPISHAFGFDRGQPIDRYFIEKFFSSCAQDIRGRVLEIGDPTYTRQFGKERVTKSDVLHVKEGNPAATMVGDLTSAGHIPSDTFDCVILPQTLQFIYDVPAALRTVYRILTPGGVVLATFPGISQKSGDEWEELWCWSFTKLSARRRFEDVFPSDSVRVEAYGNVLAAASFLYGIASEELTESELDHHDRRYEMLLGVRAQKPK